MRFSNKSTQVCLLLGILTLILFWPMLGNDFINYDDPAYLTSNSYVKHGLSWAGILWAFQTTAICNWHPLTWISHMIDCSFFGLNPAGHHLVNLLFHVANSLLLFVLLKRMTGAFWRSVLVAALFAWHPLHVESVAWASERKDMLSTLFWLLATMTYVEYATQQRRKFYIFTLILFTLGLMCKPMVVTLPCALLLLDVWPLNRVDFAQKWFTSSVETSSAPALPLRTIISEKVPLFLLSLASSLVTMVAQRNAMSDLEVAPVHVRVVNALVSYFRYIEKTFWPTDLAVIYPYPKSWPLVLTVISAICVGGITFYVIWRLRQKPYLALGWFWFLGTLVPTIGLVQVGSQSMADRYMYIPSIGFFIFLVWGLHDFTQARPQVRKWAIGVCVLFTATCAFLTSQQLRHWKNSLTVFTHAAQVTQRNVVAFYGLGNYYSKHNQPETARFYYQEALRLDPKNAETHYDVGTLLLDLGQLEKAVESLQMACQLGPKLPLAHSNLGKAYFGLGHIEAARTNLIKAAELDPTNPLLFYNLGLFYLKQSKLEEAVLTLSEAVRLDPQYAEAHESLGIAYMMQNASNLGLSHLSQAVQLNSTNLGIRFNYGKALLNSGNPAEAEKQFLECVRQDPANMNYAEQAKDAHEKSMLSKQP